MSADEVQAAVLDAKRKTLIWNLWDLARQGEIQRVGRLYAANTYRPPSLLEAVTEAATDED